MAETSECTHYGQTSQRSKPDQAADANEAIEADDHGSDQAEPSTPPTSARKTKRNACLPPISISFPLPHSCQTKRLLTRAVETLMSSPFRRKTTTGAASLKETEEPPRTKQPKAAGPSTTSQHLTRPGRNALGAYIRQPASFPSSTVLYHNASFVVIRDKYPKSSIHLLLLPRTDRSTLHPFAAFQDAALLAATRAEAANVRRLVAEELRRMYGRFSARERVRREAVASGAEDALPEGRDWESEVLVGVHAGPSMNHLHVHVLSPDRISECLRHRKHYNSFNTSFFVRLDELPLAEDDPRWRKDRGGGLGEDMKCWRCGRSFGDRFKKLKDHLQEEFELWKRE